MSQNSPLGPLKHGGKHIPLKIVLFKLLLTIASKYSFTWLPIDTLRSYQGTPLHAL